MSSKRMGPLYLCDVVIGNRGNFRPQHRDIGTECAREHVDLAFDKEGAGDGTICLITADDSLCGWHSWAVLRGDKLGGPARTECLMTQKSSNIEGDQWSSLNDKGERAIYIAFWIGLADHAFCLFHMQSTIRKNADI